MTIKTAVAVTALYYLSIGNLLAVDNDDRIRFVTSKTLLAPGSVSEDGEFSTFEKQLDTGSFDPQARVLLGAAEKFTNAIFNFHQLQFLRAITRRDEGDVLLAEWKIEGPIADGRLILKDTPVFSNYIFRITDADLISQKQLGIILLNLLPFEKPPLELSRLQIEMPADGLLSSGFYGQVSRSATLNSIFKVSGYKRGSDLFMTIQIGKTFTQKYYYPIAPFVPERFPPLADSVKLWSFGQIRQEVGRTLTPGSGIDEYRDAILVHELVQRGLSQDQFLELLQNAQSRLGYRAGLVLRAMERAGQKTLITKYFEPALGMYERLGPGAGDAVNSLFRAVARTCTTQFEPSALRLIKNSMFEEGALLYLNRCASSEETLRQMELLPVPSRLIESKKVGLIEIRKRLGKSTE
jgi:hypothetical protein